MKFKTFAFAGALTLAIFLFAQRRPTPMEQPLFTNVIDLTHLLNTQVPTFSDDDKYTTRTVGTMKKEGYFAREIDIPEHFGTHMDAPVHMSAGAWTIDQVPPERLVRPLVVLDVRAEAKGNPDYQVSLDDIGAWEQTHGHIPEGAVVFARTGWDEHWNSQKAYRNADVKGVMHFPGYSLEAAEFLVSGRQAVALGIDTLSVDAGVATDFPVHRYCGAHNVYHVENVANLGAVPPVGATVIVAPPKFEGGSGTPVRVLAMVTSK